MDERERCRRMVENQLRPSNVTDPRVLEAMGAVLRSPFLPATLKSVAYGDDDLVLADGRFLIEPLVLARLLQVASPRPTDTALVVGCDTGYVAVVLAELVGTVFAAIAPEHLDEVEARITALGAVNVFPFAAVDALAGDAERGPFDVIVVVGRVAELPAALTAQLGEGGRLVAVVGEGRVGRGVLATQVHGHLGQRAAFDAAIPPVRGQVPAPTFEL